MRTMTGQEAFDNIIGRLKFALLGWEQADEEGREELMINFLKDLVHNAERWVIDDKVAWRR